jgi:hypothetical protein
MGSTSRDWRLLLSQQSRDPYTGRQKSESRRDRGPIFNTVGCQGGALIFLKGAILSFMEPCSTTAQGSRYTAINGVVGIYLDECGRPGK